MKCKRGGDKAHVFLQDGCLCAVQQAEQPLQGILHLFAVPVLCLVCRDLRNEQRATEA